MGSYLRKAISGLSYVFIFTFLAMISGYVFRLVLARNLTTEQYGLFYAVLSAVIFFYVLNDLGLKPAIIKFIPEFLVRKEYDKINISIIQTTLIWIANSTIILIISILLSNYLAVNYFRNSDANLLLIIISASFLLFSIDSILSYVFQGFQRMGIFSSVDFTRSTSYLIITALGFILFPGSIFVPAWAYFITPFILVLIYFPILKIKVFPKLKIVKFFDIPLLKKMVYFGVPVTVISFSSLFFQQSSILLLTYFGTLKDVALLNVALPTSSLAVAFSSAIAHVIFPLSSELWTRNYKDKLREGTMLLYKYSFIIIIPVCLVLFSFPRLIVDLLFGSKYLDAASSLMVLAIGAIFLNIANINFNILAGIGRTKEPLKITIIMVVVSVILNILLIPIFGVLGSALAISISYFLAMILSLFFIRSIIEIRVPFIFWIKNLITGLIFLGVVFLLTKLLDINPYLKAIIISIIAGIIYLISVFLLKMTSINELKNYFQRAIKK